MVSPGSDCFDVMSDQIKQVNAEYGSCANSLNAVIGTGGV